MRGYFLFTTVLCSSVTCILVKPAAPTPSTASTLPCKTHPPRDFPLASLTRENDGATHGHTLNHASTLPEPVVCPLLQKPTNDYVRRRTYECTRKDALSKNMNRMRQVHGERHFDFVPRGYVLPAGKSVDTSD